MKIALVNIYSEPFGVKNTSGLITSATKLAQENSIFIPVAFGKPKKSHAIGWEYAETIADLNKYDFIIFSAFGTISNHKSYLRAINDIEELKKPFAVQSHSELDETNKRLDPERFINHRMFRFWMPITPDLYKIDPVGKDQKYPFLAHESVIRNTCTTEKKNIVAATSRLTTTKRIRELASISKNLLEFGYETWSFSSPDGAFFYKKSIDELDHCMNWGGGFTQDQIGDVLADVRYHWNCRYYKVGVKMDRRLELATIEALQNGCIPIVQSSSTPVEYEPFLVFRDVRSELAGILDDVKAGKGDVAKAIELFNDIHSGKNERLIAHIKGVL